MPDPEARAGAGGIFSVPELLDRLGVGTFRSTPEGELLHASRAFLQLLGFSSLEQARKVNTRELYATPSDREDTVDEVLARGHIRDRVLQLRRRDGGLVWVSLTELVHTLPDGRRVLDGLVADAGARVAAAQDVEASARRYRELLEQANVAIFLADASTGALLHANRRALEVIGRSLDEVRRMHQADLHPPEERARYEAIFRQHAAVGTGSSTECEVVDRAGNRIPVEITASVIELAGRQVVQGVFHDLRGLRQAQQALQESQARQAAILAALPVAVYTAEVPADLDAQWMSASVERFAGFPAERFMREPGFWADRIHPDDRAGAIAAYREAVARGEAQIEYRWQVADGTYRWLSDHALRVAQVGPLAQVIGVIADITERRAAEQALRASEEKYRELVERVSEVIFAVSDEGRVTYASPAVERVLGMAPAEVEGRHFSELVHPDDLAELVESFRRTLAGELHPLEYRLRHRDGSFRWVRSSSRPVVDGDRTVGLHGVLIDITQRREAEAALRRYARRVEAMHEIDLAILAARSTAETARATLARLRQIIPAQRAAIIVVHPASGAGEYVAVDSVPELAEPSSGRVELSQLLAGELERNRTLYLSDLASYVGQGPALDQLRARGVRTLLVCSFTIEADLVAQLVLSSRQPDAFSPDDQEVAGEVAGMLGVVLHQARLRERLEEQQRMLATLLSQLPDGVLMLGHDHRVALANPVAHDYLALLGHADREAPLTQLGGVPLASVLTPRPGGLPHELHTQGAEPRVLELRARPTVNGTESAWILVIHDATREHHLARSLEQQDRLAVIGQLAGGLAHDFNNLLTAILTHAELLLRDPEQRPAAREALRVIKEQTERSAKLIRSMLDFSRGSGSERDPLELGAFVADVAQILARTIPERIRIEVDRDASQACHVYADATQLQQVIMNIAVNARDAMPGQGVLRLSVRPLTLSSSDPPPVAGMAPGRWVHLALADTGSGIRPEHLPHIFEPFFTTKAHGAGTGLGLSQVYGLVAQNEGFVQAQSRWGEGTTIHVYLPEHRGALPAPPPPVAELPPGRGELVLLAEDEAQVRAAIEQALVTLGYRVETVSDGREALERLRSGSRVDLLITDLTMPVMGGEELVRLAREAFPELPIVVLTGYAPGRLVALQELGITRLAQKPLGLADLARTVRAALG
ncbi:MAG TPA: PAS domain S-box protein [Thermoanaerobaculaceae bacterium]|nr:PAS domain S-box protein [Thermoanaerobaculaceae bacterium]HRS15290.1 PAS domain S-box protein [Thermoanaerobaculaceae bacterium]